MKKILITGGPTNEYIDEVMKITNMSTGSLSTALGGYFSDAGYDVCLILNNSVHAEKLEGKQNVEIRRCETTMEMMDEIKKASENGPFDFVIHAAAVGDYTGEFSFLLEDMAEEIYSKLGQIKSAADILAIMENPDCKLDDSSKISSYQKNLTAKLALTPKIIARLREWFPNATLIGCKLLENVPKEELYSVAQHLAEKNSMDYILANDLADLRKGLPARHLVTKDGFTGTHLDEPKDIFEFVNSL